MEYVENMCFDVDWKWTKAKWQQNMSMKRQGIYLFIEIALDAKKKKN